MSNDISTNKPKLRVRQACIGFIVINGHELIPAQVRTPTFTTRRSRAWFRVLFDLMNTEPALELNGVYAGLKAIRLWSWGATQSLRPICECGKCW